MKLKAVLFVSLFVSVATIGFAQTNTPPVPVGGWDVSFTLIAPTTANTSRHLMFMSFSDGTATFRVIGPRTASTVRTIFPAVWSRVTTDFISFSGEVEFPIGNCCRETGTLIFKGNSTSNSTFSGAVIFVSNVPASATAKPYVIRTGTFTATPLPIINGVGPS